MVRFKQLIKIKTRDTCKIFERINHLLLLLLLLLKRFNPWGDTRRQQQDAWNKSKFDMTKDDVDSFVVDMKTLASILGHNDEIIMEKFKDVFPDPNIEAALIAMDDFALMQKKAK